MRGSVLQDHWASNGKSIFLLTQPCRFFLVWNELIKLKHYGFCITWTLQRESEATTHWRQCWTERIMIWASSCHSLWPASLWFTVSSAECRKHSHEFDVSWVTVFLSRRKTENFFLSPHFTFVLKGFCTQRVFKFMVWFWLWNLHYIMRISASSHLHFYWTASGKSSFAWFVNKLIQVCAGCTSPVVTILGPVLWCPW